MVYANVAVNHTIANESTLSYLITPDQLLKIKPGILVEVPFRSQKIKGVVVGLTKSAGVETAKLKPIKRVLSDKVLVLPAQIRLAKWIAAYYGVSLGEAVFIMIPTLRRKMI